MPRRAWMPILGLVLAALVQAAPAKAVPQQAGAEVPHSSIEVIQQFAPDDDLGPRRIELKRKREILFWMGLGLLVLLVATAGLGIAMVVFEKDVFVAHMVLAGLTLTLAAAHAATSIAWFWPY